MNNNNQLQPGVYPLPNNCRAFVCNGKVIVLPKSNAIDNTPRCRDCEHCIMAKKQYNQYYSSPVCKMQPKENKGYRKPEIKKQQRYYAVRPSDAACENFKPKTDKK